LIDFCLVVGYNAWQSATLNDRLRNRINPLKTSNLASEIPPSTLEALERQLGRAADTEVFA
jgi:hypothetical protein